MFMFMSKEKFNIVKSILSWIFNNSSPTGVNGTRMIHSNAEKQMKEYLDKSYEELNTEDKNKLKNIGE